MEIPAFDLLTVGAEGEAVVKIVGELDLATAPRLRDALSDLARQGAKHVTIDLADMDFIDSTGLSVLVVAWRRMREAGGELTLQSPNAAAMKVFEITGAARILTITGAPTNPSDGDGEMNGEALTA